MPALEFQRENLVVALRPHMLAQVFVNVVAEISPGAMETSMRTMTIRVEYSVVICVPIVIPGLVF